MSLMTLLYSPGIPSEFTTYNCQECSTMVDANLCKGISRMVQTITGAQFGSTVLTSKGFGISHCKPSRIMTISPLPLQVQVYILRCLSKYPSLPNRCSSPKTDTRGLGLPSDIPADILTHAFRLRLPIVSARKATSCP